MKDKGITLIALVITIIVLLILAGISIAMLTGENGILNKATTAKENTVAADEKEKVSLAYNDVLADKLDGTSSGDITVAEMEQALERQGVDNTKASVEKINGEDKIKVTFIDTNHEYEVNTKINGGTTGTTPTTIQPSTYYLGLREGDEVVYTYNGTEIPCIVLYDADPSRSYASDNYGVQIITKGVVEEVTLGYDDQASTGEEKYQSTRDSYNNAIEILNEAAEGYLNLNIALDARCVGSVPNDKNSKNTTKYTRDDSWFAAYDKQFEVGEDIEGYETNYITDKDKLDELNIGKINGGWCYYWMASRYAEEGSTYNDVVFGVHSVNSDGVLCSGQLARFWGGNPNAYWNQLGFINLRPVFTLRPDVKVVDGENNTRVLVKGD